MARRRGLEDGGPGLDLIPVLSLVVHLIPMLLLSVRFLGLAQLSARGPVVPALEAPDRGALAEQSKKVVSVEIDDEGFLVGGAAGLDPRIPCKGTCTPDSYDLPALATALRALKEAHPDETRIVIVPAETVPFEVVASVMAASRSELVGGSERMLFPEPLLAVRQ
jgi:biopolymer transport protein ExbD